MYILSTNMMFAVGFKTIWRTVLLVYGVKCFEQINSTLPTDVTYAANGIANTTIQGKVQEKPVLSPPINEVMENRSLELTCYTSKGATETMWGTINEPNKFSYLHFVSEGVCAIDGFLAESKNFETKCYRNGNFKVIIKRVKKKNDGQKWYCFHNFVMSNSATISVPVPFKTVNIENFSGGVLKTAEKMKVTLTCDTSDGPSANISWIRTSKNGTSTQLTHGKSYQIYRIERQSEGNMTIVQSSIDIIPLRTDNDTRVICEASNGVRKEVTLNVQYPPSEPLFFIGDRKLNDSVRIISGNNLSVVCKSESHPHPTYIWNSTRSSEFVVGQYLNLSKINENMTWQCTSKNIITLPNKTMIYGKNSTHLKVHQLYGTSKPVLYMQKRNFTINGTLFTIRNDNVTLMCRSDGNPLPNYQWFGNQLGAQLQITSITKTTSKTCIASNIMLETFGEIRHSSSNTTVTIVVSYPPGNPYLQFTRQDELAKNGTFLTNKIIVEENSSFSVTCYADGYPSPLCAWNIQRTFKSPHLSFTNISRNSTGFYRCFAENVIKRSFPALEVKRNSTTDLEIDVLYPSNILLFYLIGRPENRNVFEVTENETIIFNCSVESNPASSIVLSFRENQLGHDPFSKALIHTLRIKSCFDDGIYQCASQNRYNSEPVVKELKLLVRCTPRVSPELNPESTLYTARDLTVTFEYKAVAHPLPQFQWFKWDGSSWNIVKPSNNYKIHTSGLSSNFTIRSVNVDNYGNYKLSIQNEVGSIEQVFFLKPDDFQGKLRFTLSGKEGHKFTVNKSVDISLKCSSNRDHPSDIFIRKQEGEQIIFIKNTSVVRHTIHDVSCDDAGEYVCSVRNLLAVRKNLSSTLMLIVKCPPTPLAVQREDDIFSPVLYSDVTVSFEVHKYFDESNNTAFIWYKQNSLIPNDGSKYIISSKEFQSNLVIRNITITDFGKYRVLVQNSYGQYIHFFELQKKEEQKTVKESRTDKIVLVVTVVTSGITILAIISAFIGYKQYSKRQSSNSQVSVDNSEPDQEEVSQTSSRHDISNANNEEDIHVYEEMNEQLVEGALYMEMQSIESDDSTKFYITPIF